MYNTLAEIQRNCNKVTIGKWKVKRTSGNKIILDQEGMRSFIILEPVQHPTKDFNIWSNEQYYVVRDGDIYTMYESRTIKKPAVETAG